LRVRVWRIWFWLLGCLWLVVAAAGDRVVPFGGLFYFGTVSGEPGGLESCLGLAGKAWGCLTRGSHVGVAALWAGGCFGAVRHLLWLLSGDGLAGLGFGLVPALASFGVWGVGAGEQLVGAVYVAGAERLPGLPVRLGGQAPPVDVTCGLRQILTMGRNVPGGGCPVILEAFADQLTGWLDQRLHRLAARRLGLGAGVLGVGVSPVGLGVRGRSVGWVAGPPAVLSGGSGGSLVNGQTGCACRAVCWAAGLIAWDGLPGGLGVDGDAVAGWAGDAEASGMQGVGVASEHLLGPC
jgi:hypothetical protein